MKLTMGSLYFFGRRDAEDAHREERRKGGRGFAGRKISERDRRGGKGREKEGRRSLGSVIARFIMYRCAGAPREKNRSVRRFHGP